MRIFDIWRIKIIKNISTYTRHLPILFSLGGCYSFATSPFHIVSFYLPMERTEVEFRNVFSRLSKLEVDSKLRVDSSGIHRQIAQTPWFFLYLDSH
jgi:hypothetical protein